MDSIGSAFPVHYSTLEEGEFDDLSAGSEEEDAEESDAEDGEGSEAEAEPEADDFCRPRLEAWLVLQPPQNEARTELINMLRSRLAVTSQFVTLTASARQHVVEFSLIGMECRYEQCSQAEASSAVWEVSGGGLELVPNVKAELTLDGDRLVGCELYATDAAKGSRWADEQRLGERFGTETLAKMGGLETLLQFLGAVCLDGGAPCYYEALPFGLPESLAALGAPGAPREVAEGAAASGGSAAGAAAKGAKKPPKPKAEKPGGFQPKARAAPAGGAGKPAAKPPQDSSSKPAAPRPKPRSSSQSRKT